MDGAQLEYLGRRLDRLIAVFETVLEEVRWSHRDDPMPAQTKQTAPMGISEYLTTPSKGKK